MTFARHRALPWAAAVAGALALNGAVLWGTQKALARSVANTVTAPIQVVMMGATPRQKVAAPRSASAGAVARPVARSSRSNTPTKPATSLVTQPTVKAAAARQAQPSPVRSAPQPDSLAQVAESASETAATAGQLTAVARASSSVTTVPAAGGASVSSAATGGEGGGAAAGGAAQDTVVLPSERAAYLNNPPPDYPPMSLLRGESGTPVVHVLIGVDGRAHAARIEKSSGYARLDDAALTTARDRWRYRPGTRNGTPETMWYDVPIRFVLQ